MSARPSAQLAVPFNKNHLERALLREGESGQGHSVGRFGHLHLDGGCVGRCDLGGTQGCVLREDFVVDLGDEEVLASRVLTPDLSELNGFHGHWFVLGFLLQSNGRRGRRQWNGTSSLVVGPWSLGLYKISSMGRKRL